MGEMVCPKVACSIYLLKYKNIYFFCNKVPEKIRIYWMIHGKNKYIVRKKSTNGKRKKIIEENKRVGNVVLPSF